MFTAETCWEQLKAESSITYHPFQDSGSIMEEGTNRTWSWRKRWNVENASIRAWRDYCILELSGAVIISKRPVYDWPTDILPQTGVGHEAPFLPENINASSAVAHGKEALKEEGQHSSRLYFDQACQSPTQSLCWKPMLREWSFWWWNTTEALGNWVAEKKDQRVKWLMCRHKSRAQQPVCEPVLGNRKWGKAIPYDFLASQSRFSEEILSQTIRLRATGGNPLKLIPTFMCVCMPDTCMDVGTHTHAQGHV